jgi:hypothetical protein
LLWKKPKLHPPTSHFPDYLPHFKQFEEQALHSPFSALYPGRQVNAYEEFEMLQVSAF